MAHKFIILILVGSAWSSQEISEKRGTSDVYTSELQDRSDRGNAGHYDHSGALSYSHFVQQFRPYSHRNRYLPVEKQIASHKPYDVVPVSVVPPTYQVQFIKPLYLDKALPVKPHSEYVLTKVPLVYHATYPDLFGPSPNNHLYEANHYSNYHH